jgi:AraC-like DNA-binding protein
MRRNYLSNSVLELNEAAYLLGFEDPNPFGRAFRAWEGMPPSDWRESHNSRARERSQRRRTQRCFLVHHRLVPICL